MPIAALLHNPKAGDKDHSEEKLIAVIEQGGFECNYASLKEEGWEEIPEDADLVVIVGGDGTIRKVAKVLLTTVGWRLDIGLLPAGTANNIAKTLQIDKAMEPTVQSWHQKKVQAMDVGVISGLPDANFFIEGFGFGIFPKLMHDIKKIDKQKLMDTPEKEIMMALKMLRDIVLNYEAKYCHLVIDGVNHSGNFILAEVMNIRSLGPNLVLAPNADPGDGLFEIILLPENQRHKFADHLLHLCNAVDCPPYPYQTLTGQEIKFKWDGRLMHADDELIEIDHPVQTDIKVHAGALSFLVR
ncbi:diacylglycerol kinase [Mucilaginibacter hurinus]|uniref:Diacylglycerol kinase n=1 Tax=Mucilaginibacter hurinus TaxID=2201324 RepID=A0A367GN12_9SPHI|nr:diacylglycerol kinase family protein [Mucilaginibacter hurinus]RCH54071.1 diacylglycerol kinase [Mucilaginibacter hurinus]